MSAKPKPAQPAQPRKGQAPAKPAKGKIGNRQGLPAKAQVLTREQWPIRPISGWTAEAIMAAREAHDQGQWAQAESLYAALRTIDRIHAALESRCNAVRAFGFALTCPRPGEAPARLCEAAATLHESWPAVVMSEMTRSEIIERVVMFGFCLARVQWIYRDGQRMPSLQPWSHGSLIYDWAQRCIIALDENGKQHHVPLQGADPNEWVVFSVGGATPWLKGAIRPLARDFFLLAQAYDRWASYNDKEAEAIRVVKCPALQRESRDAQDQWASASELRGGDTMLAPEGWGLDLVESKSANKYETFEKLLQAVERGIAIVILGHSSAQETTGASGTYGSTAAALAVAADRSVTDVVVLATALADVMRLWVSVNFTASLYPTPRPLQSYAPLPHWNTTPPEDAAKSAETRHKNAGAVKALSDAAGGIAALVTAGLDLAATLRMCGMPMVQAAQQAAPTRSIVTDAATDAATTEESAS